MRAIVMLVSCTRMTLDAAAVGVSPAIINTSTGNVVSVDVQVASVADLYADQFTVLFDPRILSATAVTAGLFFGAGFNPGVIDNQAGKISFVSHTRTGDSPGVFGSGSLAKIEFRAMAPGVSNVTISDVLLLDSHLLDVAVDAISAAKVSVSNPNGVVIVSPADNAIVRSSAVTFSWSPAPGDDRSYDFRLYNDSLGKSVLELRLSIIGNLTNQVYTLRSGSYHVEIRVCTPECGSVAASSTFTVILSTIPSAAPTGVSCTVANDSNQNRVNCNWSQVPGADFHFVHVIQPNTGPGGGALTVAGKQIGANSVSLLVPNGVANFIVMGCNGDGCGPFSKPFGVNPAFGNPSVPIVAEPFSGYVLSAGAGAPAPTFTWNRVVGDNGTNYKYRLYVQDFSRNAPAVDVLTNNNFHAAYINPFTRYDVLVIAIPKVGGANSQGPANGFVTKGTVPNTPSFVSPTVFSTVGAGPVKLGWTPVPDSNGNTGNRLYQVVLNGPSPQNFSTTDLTKIVPLGAGSYSGKARSCNTVGATACNPASDTGWGPYSGSANGQGGSTLFTVH